MKTDTLIIGCGIAGAAAALRLSDDPAHHIMILTRVPDPEESNTGWAQGGIVTRGLDDSPDLLVQDILEAGAGISSERASRILADEGPALVQSVLVERCGVRFDRNPSGDYIYGLEAAHRARRIVHVGDQTGAAIARQLILALNQRQNGNLLTSHTAVDLLMDEGRCIGAQILNKMTGELLSIMAGQTILATGGLGQLYQNSTNPAGARGDGIAIAARAGAKIKNAEYVQFHPTALAGIPGIKPLVSEAVRGEGAILLTPHGERFMADYAPEQMELAPRDVVARAIDHVMKANGFDHVLLDIASQRSPEIIHERFPALIENAARIGFDATCEPLPVVPAAHYFCGGVEVDEWGCTNVVGLYAVGEVSCTGLHGANRLASTSLLEGLVWGDRSARHIAQNRQEIPTIEIAPIAHDGLLVDENQISSYWDQLRRLMWAEVGIVRTAAGLDRAVTHLEELQHTIDALYAQARCTDALLGLRNALQTALIVARAAQQNRVSRGAHYREDSLLEAGEADPIQNTAYCAILAP